jgi:cytochrome c oxidase cbb3-type subunit III
MRLAIILTLITAGIAMAGTAAARRRPEPQATPAADSIRLIAHPDNIQLGIPSQTPPLALRDPYAGNAKAVAEGGKLFIAYNCLDCHGAEGAGAMGPSLQDNRWHFGGTAPEVFESIYQGRPDGMPAWGGRIADDQIWKLVAYVRSVGAGKNVATENFTGKGVERTGH